MAPRFTGKLTPRFIGRWGSSVDKIPKSGIPERERGRGRSRLHEGCLTWDLILGLQDDTLG